MEKLIFPGHIGKLEYIIPAMQVYFEADDWVNTDDYVKREFDLLKENGVETEKKDDTSDYTKDAELPRYFGFVERKIRGNVKSDCRITDLGKKFYNSIIEQNQDGINEAIMTALETITFGKNNDGCPGSNTKLEAPNILLIASLMLDGVTRQEYAGVLYEMLKHNAPMVTALVKIKMLRDANSAIIDKVRVDNKVIPFLVNLNFLKEEGSIIKLTDLVKQNFQERISKLPPTNDLENSFPDTDENKRNSDTIVLQQIYYGAPGTGKSNEIKNMTAEGGMFERDYTIRTTFHPDSDYASFVGAYKPYWKEDKDKIVYGFRPQPFLKAYIKAWKNPDKNVALIVEEINRGNCAQIFGDIFQLLDREKNGLSKYPIECDLEMKELLASAFNENSEDFGAPIPDNLYADSKDAINSYYSAHYDNAFAKIKNGEILALPMNLSILATMNTSDQSLFPMDSAFKRRWEWIYEPIVEGTDKDTGEKLKWKIEVDDTHKVDWWKFLQKINAVIYSLTSSEDKQLGYFFCQPDKEDGVTISKNLFVGKVIFYLWNEIFKDYAFEHDVCKKENKSETLYFADFYEGKSSIKQTSLVTFFSHLDENQPKIEDKDVKLIEESLGVDTQEEGAETPEDVNSEQNEETVIENPES